MEFSCSVCQYTSHTKIDVIRHISRKKSCGSGIKEIVEVPIEIICIYCRKNFSTRANLNNHIKNRCRQKDIVKDAKIAELERQLRNRNTSIKNVEDNNYIYLLKIYPYTDNIYKLGRTSYLITRLASYKRYKVVFIISCQDDVKCENDLIKIYKTNTTQCKEMGNEYFYGEYQQMKKLILDYFKDQSETLEIDQKYDEEDIVDRAIIVQQTSHD
jgi:hypothetical protein